MKKLICVVLTAVLVIGSIVAAGQKDGEATKGKTTIAYWTGDRHDLAYIEKKIDEFNKTNTKNIEIVVTVLTDDLPNMLAMAYSSGTAPDIVNISAGATGFDLKTFVDAKIISPITEYIKDPEFERVTNASNLIIEGMNAIDGKPYWIPTAVRSGTKMIYNKKLLTEAGITKLPKTLQELVTVADKITKTGKGSYYGIATTSSAPFIRWFEGTCAKSGVYLYDYKTGRFNFDGFREPIKLANQLFKNGSIFPGSPSQGVDAMRAQFAEGNFGVWANASQEAGVFTEQFPITKFEWVVGQLPSMDGTVKGTVLSRPQKGIMMISSSKNKDAAWEAIKFLSNESFIKGYIEGGYALPINTYMASKVDFKKIGRLADFALQPYEGTYPSYPAISLAGDNHEVVLWNAVRGLVDVEAAIKDLNTRYNEALDRDVKMGKIKRIIIRDFNPLKPGAGKIEYSSN